MIMYIATDEMDLELQLRGSGEINKMTNASLGEDKYAAPKDTYFRRSWGDLSSRKAVLLTGF